MSPIRTAILIIAFALLALPSAARAQCAINEFGILHIDTDCDGVMDLTTNDDADMDGLPDGEVVDNCMLAPNGNCGLDQLNCDVNEDKAITSAELAAGYQADWNHNGVGDACDDVDLDTVADYADNCKTVANATQDPDVCTDTDQDGFEDPIDNCIDDYNPDQQNSDADAYGDACDNCRFIDNPTQDPAACPDGSNSGGGGGTVNPGANPAPNTGRGVTYEPGPDVIEGNGFGEGGCQLNTSPQNASAMALLLFTIAAAVLALSAKRR